MNVPSAGQPLRERRRWLPTALALMGVGLVAAAAGVPKARQLVLSELSLSGPAHTDSDGHDHVNDTADARHHDDAGHDHTAEQAASHSGEESDHDHADADQHDHAGDKEHEHDHDGEGEHAHAKHVYDHKHDEAAAIKLSKQAQGNIGLQLARIELRPFERTITVPGMVVERPGWSVLEVTAPMTGVVTRIYPIQGEAVQPGQPLFEVRLTHEDLLQVQTEFLRTIEELDVIGREVARLEKVSADGVIAGKTLLERKYEQQKQEAALRAQRQALLLHGLSSEQVDKIVATRTLLQSLTIHVPAREEPASSSDPVRHLQVQQLKVAQGKHVNAGDTLCTLVDHHELYIEGMAFEQDIRAINRAASAGRKVSAVFGPKRPSLALVTRMRRGSRNSTSSTSTTKWSRSRGRSISTLRFPTEWYVRTRRRTDVASSTGSSSPDKELRFASRWRSGRIELCCPSKRSPKRVPRLTSSSSTTIILIGGQYASSTATRIGS